MPKPRSEQGPTNNVRIDQALYDRIVALSRQHRRSIRAQASLLLEMALDEAQQQERLRVAGEAAERRRWPALASVGRAGEGSDG